MIRRISIALAAATALTVASPARADPPVEPPPWPVPILPAPLPYGAPPAPLPYGAPPAPLPYGAPPGPLAPFAPQPGAAYRPAPWSSVDPLVPVGIVVTATGVIAAIPGLALLSASPQQVCGLNGCVEVSDSGRRHRSVGFLAASGAMLAVGVPTLIVGRSGGSPEAGARWSPRATMFGAWLTGFGAGTAAYGLSTGFTANPREGGGAAFGIGAVGVVMMTVGVPLWAVGAHTVPPGERAPAQYAPAKSEGRMNAGMALASLGTVTVASGVMVVTTMAAQPGDFAGLAALVIGGPITLAGVALLGVGLPLWITGAGQKQGYAFPAITAGPTSVQLEWRLQ